MSRQDPLDVWTKDLTKNFPDLSKPQVKGLAEWSFGMILARCCSLDSVASHMGDWLGQPERTVRSRLREWYLPAERKSTSVWGEKRTELPVHTCFAPLLRWLQRDWPVPRLALALDASTLGERFVLLAVSVLYRRCAFPVAWKILPAIAKGSWQPHWVELLQAMRGVVPDDWLVVALTDRGLWAPWTFSRDSTRWLASAYAHQRGWTLPPRRREGFCVAQTDGAAARQELVRRGHGVFDAESAAGRYVAGLVGRRARRALADLE
jgi:hypothetical protein